MLTRFEGGRDPKSYRGSPTDYACLRWHWGFYRIYLFNMSLACGWRRRQRHLQRGWTVASNLLQRYRKQGWLNLSTNVRFLVVKLL